MNTSDTPRDLNLLHSSVLVAIIEQAQGSDGSELWMEGYRL
jgi:hypothetical protein